MGKQQNWAGNFTYSTDNWHTPKNIEEVQQLVSKLSQVKVVGTRHSFNDIADSTEHIISLEYLNQVVALDLEQMTVTVEAGVKYSDLCKYLHQKGYALRNLASLPHISVAGACATATHGSGDKNSNLAASVRSLEVVTADAELVHFSREKDLEQFNAVVVSLGGLGVVTKLTLDVIPTYQVRQDLYENLSLSQLEEHFDTIFSSAYSVSLFTDWKQPSFNQVWLKEVVMDQDDVKRKPTFFGATLATEKCHPVPGHGAEHCTDQLGVPGIWYDRLPHFHMDFTPSSGREIQSEFLVPREHGYAALVAISELQEDISPILHISEIRTIASDDLWMSTSYRQDSVGIHFTFKDDSEAVKKVIPKIEAKLAPYHARPHWGKVFTMDPSQLQPLYEKLPEFRKILQHYDPKGKFRNQFLDTYIFE